MIATLAAIVGLVVGSFLGTIALRPPRGQPVLSGRSLCPHCGRTLRPGELIPLASWILQRRRCRSCGARLSLFYPAVELAGASVAGLAFALLPWPWAALACLAGWGAVAALARVVVGQQTV